MLINGIQIAEYRKNEGILKATFKNLPKEPEMTGNHEEILSRKLFLFKKIKDLADRQKDLLSNDRLDSFMSLLTQRNQVQRKIEKENKLTEKASKDSERDPSTEKYGPIALQITDVISSIQETDQKIEEMILKRKSSLIGEIRGLRQGKKVVKGYGAKPGYVPKYIDQHK